MEDKVRQMPLVEGEIGDDDSDDDDGLSSDHSGETVAATVATKTVRTRKTT